MRGFFLRCLLYFAVYVLWCVLFLCWWFSGCLFVCWTVGLCVIVYCAGWFGFGCALLAGVRGGLLLVAALVTCVVVLCLIVLVSFRSDVRLVLLVVLVVVVCGVISGGCWCLVWLVTLIVMVCYFVCCG